MAAWLSDQFEWLKSFLSEGTFILNGKQHQKASSKRLATLGVVLTFISSYGRLAWAKQDLLDIPIQWSITLPILLGIAVVGSAIERKPKTLDDGNTTVPTTH